MMQKLMLNIRRRETPFYQYLYKIAKALREFEVPVISLIYRPLQWERSSRLLLWRTFVRVCYNTPLFKLRCHKIGAGLNLQGGIPVVLGHLRLIIGNQVSIHGVSTFSGAKVFENPTLTIGDNSHLGYMCLINVGCDVTIGRNVLVGDRVSILSYDGHPADPAKRHLPAPPESSRPIIIEDNVWIGGNCVLLKGVTIGENSVIANGSVVTTNIPSNTMAMGNPARCFPLMN